ncbi:DUF805 domain-containing protein [Aquibacillus halophilus]|uniref:DUF805 domain-containing protein n=1 Tax=Aquibacillus halophilus TaxID=930132 RepID=A0A6A8DHJ8_9BACI|nr:DUF805 domain-containing protein [Aquibacillus halophilus]MRH43309.1 DUF805 domain-containing protein [Aquibacillus halophilus]
MEWYLKVIKNYAVFDGRARRTEYWVFTLINVMIGVVLAILEAISGLFGILSFFYYLFILIPGIAVTVRRLHDIGKSGWWFLIGFVPFIGPIILLVFTCLDSYQFENEYGPNPKFE